METVTLTRRPALFDRHGKIVPTEEALQKVEREHPSEPPHVKWRLAQEQSLFDHFG